VLYDRPVLVVDKRNEPKEKSLNFLSPESEEKPCFEIEGIKIVGSMKQIDLNPPLGKVTLLVEYVPELIWIFN
jgi:hypothetical protein